MEKESAAAALVLRSRSSSFPKLFVKNKSQWNYLARFMNETLQQFRKMVINDFDVLGKSCQNTATRRLIEIWIWCTHYTIQQSRVHFNSGKYTAQLCRKVTEYCSKSCMQRNLENRNPKQMHSWKRSVYFLYFDSGVIFILSN